MAATTECKYAEEADLATRYLAGDLTDSEAETFERHYLSCKICRSNLQTMSELRAALGRPPVVPTAKRRAPAPTWRLFAAAAAIAIGAVGAWQLIHRPSASPNPPVYRGTNEILAVKAESLPNERVRLSWEGHPQAQSYTVEVVRSDGVTAWKGETPEPSVTLNRTELPTPPDGVSFAARVKAFDPMHQVVAMSELTSLPQP